MNNSVSRPKPLTGKRILVIDDDEEILAYLIVVLKAEGYHVETALSAQEGLRCIEKESPNLILCDVTMPENDGNWFIKTFRKVYPELLHTPVCFLTAKSEREDFIEGLEAGVDAYLTKPIDQKLLLTTVATHLNHADLIQNMPVIKKTSAKTIWLGVGIIISTFMLDLIAPLGVAGGMPYILLVLTGWWFKTRSAIFYLATIGSVFTVAGYFLSPAGSSDDIVLTNRAYAITIMWIVASIMWMASKERSLNFSSPAQQGDTKRNQLVLFVKENIFSIVMLMVIFGSSWGVVFRIESSAREGVQKSLMTVLGTSHQGIIAQWKDHKNTAIVWASNKLILSEIKNINELPADAEVLLRSSAQAKLREWMVPVLDNVGYRGFFIINKDYINLASSRDGNVGLPNLLDAQEGFLDRVWAGETLLSLPLQSDVPLVDIHGEVWTCLNKVDSTSLFRLPYFHTSLG